MNSIRADRVLGCLIGGAIGDLLGSATEGSESQQISIASLTAKQLQISDDTQLTLATCEAILERDAVEPEAIAATMLRWFREGRLSGLGSSTLKALRDLDAGAHWALCGQRGERAAGNGAAMRIAPLAFHLDPVEHESRQRIRDVCRITHHNDEAYAGALAIVTALRQMRRNLFSLEQIASTLPDSNVRDRIFSYSHLPAKTRLADAARSLGVSGYVAESVPFALFAAAKLETMPPEEIMNAIICAGGDTDTNASLFGQLMGAKLGMSGLPTSMLSVVERESHVLSTAKRFAAAIAEHELRVEGSEVN